jgi:vacuolar-type H+-ATPase subunit E/Vma4
MNSAQPGLAGFDGPASVLDAQVDAMSQRVIQDRDQRCAQLRNDALGRAQNMLRAARHEARANVSEAVARERKQGEQALHQAQAQARLEERQRDQQQARGLLEEMWAAVSRALDSRWTDPEYRRSWVRAAIRQGQSLLSERAWRIEHGAGWSPDELNEVAKLAKNKIQLVCDNGIRAGIRIKTDGACLDATITGLLASRPQVESEFLAQYLALL